MEPQNPNLHQFSIQDDSDDDQFIVLEALTPQEQNKLKQERVKQLTQFYTTNKEYQISSWYYTLQQFTFKSYKTQLTSIDAYVLYWMYYNDRDLNKMELQHKELFDYYNQLILKIDTFLSTECKQFSHESQNECFMKLATRSPKDLGYKYSANQIDQVSQKLTNHLKHKFPQYTQMKDQLNLEFVNQIYRFFLDLSKEKFKIKSGLDFVDIFSSSQRIIIDIADFSFLKADVFAEFQKNNYARDEEPFIQLWAREWKDFKWYEELRCFYHDYNLTAICQYDQRCYFQELKGKEDFIQIEMSNFFDSLRPSLKKLNLSQGVMDLVLFGVGDQEKVQVKLIEINVFNRNSRASLFSWDRDFYIVTGKDFQRPEIRLLNQPKKIFKQEVKRLMGMIQKGTDKIIQKAMKNLGLGQVWQKLD